MGSFLPVKKNYLYHIFFFLFLCSNPLNAAFSLCETRWDWDTVDFLNVKFPRNFIWGTADSAFQTEGIETANGKTIQNSWTAWEEQEIKKKDGTTQPRIALENRAGKGCERWSRYKDDVQLLKNIGMKAHCFSIDWSKIEPEKGVFDDGAMQHYIDYMNELIDNGILPIVKLFDHNWPLWFEYPNQDIDDKKNWRKPAFEDPRNIQDFVDFALYVFNTCKNNGLLNVMNLWITFNEPVGIALAGYFYELCPPGKKFNFKRSGIVAEIMLNTHIAVYDAFKAIAPDVMIGFAHIMQPIHAYHPWNPFDQIPAKIFNYLVNDVALNYFKTGSFKWLWLIRDFNADAINKLDFIGINYYTHTVLKMFKEAIRPGEKLSEGTNGKKGKVIYAEGFYDSIKKAASLGVPIFIMENGFATDTIELRDEYIKKHLYVIFKALEEGIDIRGYFFWTLMDCYGWNRNNSNKHGIYTVDFTTQERTLKTSAQYLLDVIRDQSDGPEIEQFPKLGNDYLETMTITK